MNIGPGIVAVIAISLIAAGGVYSDNADSGQGGWQEGRSARPTQVEQLAQSAAPSPPPGQPVQEGPASAPAPAPPAGSASGTPAMVLDDQEVSGIVGKSVRSNADEDMGRIVDVIVSGNGEVRAAIVDFGGFLGIGTRKIAVDWRALKFAPAGKPGAITLDLNRNQVRVAPEYKRGEPLVVLGAAGAERARPSSEAATPER
jgi:hypothetical protein